MTEDQIKHMVDRFLSWKLPEDFRPDNGISFKPTFNDHLPTPMKCNPSGTNLFDARQAGAMVRHMVEGLTSAPSIEGGGAVAWRWRKRGTDGPWFAATNPIEGPGAADFYEIEPLFASPALAGGVGEGWVIVPREPTLDMLGAWGAGLYRNMDQGSRRDAYAAMLAAAPKPEAAD